MDYRYHVGDKVIVKSDLHSFVDDMFEGLAADEYFCESLL